MLVGVSFILSSLYGNPFLRNNLTPYKDYAGGVPAVDISVTRIYVVSLGKVWRFGRLFYSQIIVNSL